jgi:hypothetical protein
MKNQTSLQLAVNALAAAALMSLPAGASAEVSQQMSERMSLVVQPHAGVEAVDVSGRYLPGRTLKVTLVETIDRDLPDVVLSRTLLRTDAAGAFAAEISIAGYTRGSIVTVYVAAPGRRSIAGARYYPDAPNHGAVTPFDQIPRDVR